MNVVSTIAAFALAVASCYVSPGVNQEALDTGAQKHTVEYKELEGVDPNRLSLDVYSQGGDEANRPVIIWVHGGAWYLGDKANGIETKRDLFLDQGWLLVAVNYRLGPKPWRTRARRSEDRVKYPDHNNDVADAIAWVHRNIHKYGGDGNRIALLGHSAGAHLVSLTGTKPALLESRNVPFTALKGVASIDIDTYDIRAYVETGLPMIVAAFGTDGELNDDASPLFHAKKAKAAGHKLPAFFVAKRGSDRRRGQIETFVRQLQGAATSVVEFDGASYSHSGINRGIGKSGDESITPALVAFFSGVL